LSIPQSPWHDLTHVKSLCRLCLNSKASVDILGGIWHLLNFFASAAGIGLFASLMAKLLWRHQLAGAAWWRLWLFASVGAAGVAIGGLVYFGRDGKMATYAGMVLACALGLWWAGFRRGARR
jgi:hypothetical protein